MQSTIERQDSREIEPFSLDDGNRWLDFSNWQIISRINEERALQPPVSQR
jgi:hypothetical protein